MFNVYMGKWSLIVILLLVSRCIGNAQNSEFTSLDIGFDYFDNTNTFGQFNQLTKQPSYSPSLFFVHKSGFTATGIASLIENSDTTLSKSTIEFDIMFGYYWKINKHFSVYPNYTHYFIPCKSSSLKSVFTDNFAIDADYTLYNFQSGINVSYLLGENNQWFVTPYITYTIEIEDFPFKNNYLLFQPELNANFGDQTYLVNDAITLFKTDITYRQNLLRNPAFKEEVYKLRTNTNLSDFQIISLLLLDEAKEENQFNLTSIGATLPISYMIGNLSVNAGFSFYYLFNKPDYAEEDYQTYINFGLAYSFYWE